MRKHLIAGLLLVLLCGCFKTKDELTINADGSGKVRIETRSSLPAEFSEGMGMTGMMSELGGAMYPPMSESEARAFFPGTNFIVAVKQDRATNGETTVTIDVDFKDINALLASPYGRAHQLSMQIENGALVVKGLMGLETAARFAEMKPDPEMGMMMAGLPELQKHTNEMRGEFRITLPNAIASSTGAHEGKTASWVAERAKTKDAEEFARQLGAVLEARCPADALKFSPETPVRLALKPFSELVEGVASAKTAGIDTNKIAAAAKFVPYGLTVSRSVDLSGEGSRGENQGQLIGAIVLPPELAPQKWGEAKLEEAVDAKGNNLKLKDSDEGRFFSRVYSQSSFGSDGDENEDATNTASGVRRVVTLGFRPPDWKVTEIARIKGSVSLQYFGGSQVVAKLTNAIPANWIMDATKMMGGSIDSSEKSLSSAKLGELGLSVGVEMCMSQSGMTMLSLRVSGKEAALTDAQVFDAQGRPWPTTLSQQDAGEDGSSQIVVAGKPQPPLSIALLASGGGASIEVPILVEHVPVMDK